MRPVVAIANEFLEAFSRVPRAQQRKFQEFTRKFQADPTSAAINYEKIHSIKDPRVRTVRIDQKYRGIVLRPEEGNVFVLVWVDNHDEAMAWAEKRTFEVNPTTGALQVFNLEEAERAVAPEPASGQRAGAEPGLLDEHPDETLLAFGVPEVLLPAVRAVRAPEGLLRLARHLPAEGAEALLWLAEGLPAEEVRAAVGTAPAAQRVDPGDIAAALRHPDSRRRFVTINSDHDLASILDAPLETWRVFLHPSQERLVSKSFRGSAQVTGGPGTGKTVVAMHRARHLARNACPAPGDRVLFTTFTSTLAQNIQENLRNLCGAEADRVEVVNIHAWAVRLLRAHGIQVDVASPEELDALWEEAALEAEELEFDLAFLRQEWEGVVQDKGIRSRDEYLRVLRLGRGRTLTRAQRSRVWRVFERFEERLGALGKREWLGVIREARELLARERPALPYRAVVVDEAQDFHAEEWKLVRAILPPGPDDLFIVGDAHQRIYGKKVALRGCGIGVQGRSSRLRINYRTTEQIRAWAMRMLAGLEVDDLDGGQEDSRGYVSLLSGSSPEIRHFGSAADEHDFLKRTIAELVGDRPPEHVCLVARTKAALKSEYLPVLKAAGVEAALLERKDVGRGVRLATMHRVKGLEFPVMILAGVDARSMPQRARSLEGDAAALAEHEARERALLFVAATRARERLIVTSSGTPSPFLSSAGGQ